MFNYAILIVELGCAYCWTSYKKMLKHVSVENNLGEVEDDHYEILELVYPQC
jgi:hypothetical protein